MLAESLLSKAIPSLKTSDTVLEALERMSDFKLYHLPLVNDSQFLGLLAEEELLAIKDQQMLLGKVRLSMSHSFAYSDAHLYNVIMLFNELQLSVVPILDRNKNYVGVVSITDLLSHMAKMFAINEPGGIIVLATSSRDNSLSHIAQIVESDHAQILSSYVNSFPNSTALEITLKINKTELSSIIAAFERYNYEVKAVFNNTQNPDYISDRFDSLMKYLNV